MRGTVVVTASAGTFPGLLAALHAIPVAVEEHPLMSFAPPLDWRPVDAALDQLSRYDAVAFTSPRSARAFVDRVVGSGKRELLQSPAGPAIWAAGAGTAVPLGELSMPLHTPDGRLTGSLGAAGALARAMLEAGIGGPVLFPCGEIRRDELPARLRDDGVEVEELVCYRSVLAGEGEARLAAQRGQVVVVASPSVADLLARSCPSGSRPALLAVGPTTAAAARASGWPPAGVAARPTAEALAAGVRTLLSSR
jgi:uroporphyrinogen-III synthase